MRTVLIVAFDGLQPSQVTPQLMPNLAALAADGVTFANHHPVFPTTTRANVASLVTGCRNGTHGIAANTIVIPEFNPYLAIPALRDQLSQITKTLGCPILVPTLADILWKHDQEYVAIGVGTSGNAYLQNPTAVLSGGATIHPDFTLPDSLHQVILDRFGPWPEEMQPNTSRMAHAVRIMTEYILPERMPAVSLIWSSEPDKSQHQAGVGSDLSNAAIREADDQFGFLIKWLERRGRTSETDVIVISDHGYSTIKETVNVESQIRAAEFPPDKVVVASNGGAVLFYIPGEDRTIANRLAIWLMEQPWCGTVTVSQAVGDIPGTLPASLVGNEGPRAPSITMSFRWNSTPNAAGYPGFFFSNGGTPGQGNHGSMSKQELRSVLIGAGSSFKRGVKLETPSGIIDIAPTVLRILGITGDTNMEGRVLEEALTQGLDSSAIQWSKKAHSNNHKTSKGTYRQQIMISGVGNCTYVDEGNGGLENK